LTNFTVTSHGPLGKIPTSCSLFCRDKFHLSIPFILVYRWHCWRFALALRRFVFAKVPFAEILCHNFATIAAKHYIPINA
jgi:hypothetical protein